MIDYVASQSNWFLPQLVQLLNSPAAALLPALPVLSFMSTRDPFGDDDPPWASLWTEAEVDRDVRPSVISTIAITEQEHRVADALVNDRYAWRGYGSPRQEEEISSEQREVTLLAWSAADAAGTMTMGFDDGKGLSADRTFAAKIDAIRSKGRTVCEFTRFAVSAAADSKATISGLFDLSYVIGRKMLGVTDVVVEVNPRHVGFYRRAFGFQPISDVRTCERVNAPAVLLQLDVADLEGRMRHVGAKTPGEVALARAAQPVQRRTESPSLPASALPLAEPLAA
jgi:hypothetical protein